MPTIEQLQPVVVSSDDDSIPVSQGGIVRRVSRAQLLAGTQPALSLSTGLVGRSSPGFGPPEPIGVGGGLLLANGVLSGPPPFAVSRLPQVAALTSGDLIAASKSGHDVAISVGALLAVTGIDVSAQLVKTAAGIPRKLADWIGDSLNVEAFGAVGDGLVDDSLAFARALASGQPVRLGAKTYRVDGQWTITAPAIMLGTAGASTLRRTRQTGGAWINIVGPAFKAIGVTFDAGGLVDESWAVQVSPSCRATLFDTCTFKNAMGPTLGSGLTIQARDGVDGPPSAHTIRHCTFLNNNVHGLWLQAAAGSSVESCSASRNGAYGLCLDFNDPSFSQVVRNCSVVGCRSWNNQRGISIGNYNELNTEPPRWGPANPDARDILVAENVCFDNSAYGVAASGLNLSVINNQVSITNGLPTASGFLFNACQSRLSGNSASGFGQFGIDAGGCIDAEINDNFVSGFQVGINAGGGLGVKVRGNRLFGNLRGITAFQVETDGAGNNFGLACKDLRIEDNSVQLPSRDASGIAVFDGPQNVRVSGNDLSSVADDISAGILIHTDQAVITSNRWNGSASYVAEAVQIGGLSYLRAPEIVDTVRVPSTGKPISGFIGQHQFEISGQISFVRVTQPGSGYSKATVTIAGSGVGAEGTCYVRHGLVIGIALTSGGSGYGAGDTQVLIKGDGQGAAALAFVGLPVLEGRRLTFTCEASVSLRTDGAIGPFENRTSSELNIPARSEVVFVGSAGRWQATNRSAIDHLIPAINGSGMLRSPSGDLTLRPAAAGVVRIASDTETGGFASCLGRGAPEGVVTAPPGSDYRNLDGGAGQTLWLKRTGTGNTGWFAIG